MGRPIVTTLTLTAGSANAIALSQTLGAAGPLTLNGAAVSGGVATLSPARRVVITSAGNDSGITWTITGTARAEQSGAVQTETIAGGNAGGAVSTQDFATVTSIVGSGASAGAVTAGTNNTASGPWVVWSQYAPTFQVGWTAITVAGSPGYQVDFTDDDVFGLWLTPGTLPVAQQLTGMSALTGNTTNAFTSPIRASRLTLTSAGSVRLTQLQLGS